MKPIKREDYTILSGEIRRPVKPKASMAALSWAADRAGISYGKLIQGLSPEQEAKIQIEYGEWKRMEAEGRAKHAAERVPAPLTDTEDIGILIDSDM